MSSGERRVWTDEGLLTWDGRVLELFATDGSTNRWRVHGATVRRWEIEPRRGRALLKVYDHDRHYENVLIAEDRVPLVRSIMAEVDAAQ